MNRNIVFKTLIDILFIFQAIGVLGVFIIIPFGITKINQINLNIEKWSVISWILVIFGFMAYFMFMVGLYYLRKVGRYLLLKRYFTIDIISNLKKSGVFLIYSGVFGFVGFVIAWVIKLSSNRITFYDTDISLPLFIGIIGLFFSIQSEALFAAKSYKEENDLTI